ncbi:MAG: divergent PAP2 family protein [Candidatus Andersenbacteria bacterium]|nr:divergent PAP2 family protein [Candidatus Andersenbacteria bacterium]
MPLPLFLIPIVAGLAAQALKPLINKNWRSQPEGKSRWLLRYGGMPSAHTAFAFSLATVVGVVDGLTSTGFAIACAGVVFVLDDALRMRIFLSRHGLALRRLIRTLPPEQRSHYPQLETHLGHSLAEVTAGALLGIGLTLLVLLPLNALF